MTKTKEQISYNMSQVKNKDSKIELMLRKELWTRKLRYRINCTKITGKPDIVFIGIKLAVFCDGEFWHGYKWEEKAKNEHKRNTEFWYKKIERNMARDEEVNNALKEQGWTVLRFWGKDITKNPGGCADIIEETVQKLKGRNTDA